MYLERGVTTLPGVSATRALAFSSAVLALAACGGAGGKGDAYRACERAVESTLKAPATADFSGALGSDITERGGGLFDVVGHVDSENGFGANVRTNFSCTVRNTGDNWELVDLSV
jgi:hypothetical protein